MQDKTETIDVRVDSLNTRNPPCIGEDTPDVEITVLQVSPLTPSAVKQIQYHFFWQEWHEAMQDVDGYNDYQRFRTCRNGDIIRVVYTPIFDRPTPEAELKPIDPEIISVMRGDYVTTGGGSYACHPAKSVPVRSLENLTQGWKIQ